MQLDVKNKQKYLKGLSSLRFVVLSLYSTIHEFQTITCQPLNMQFVVDYAYQNVTSTIPTKIVAQIHLLCESYFTRNIPLDEFFLGVSFPLWSQIYAEAQTEPLDIVGDLTLLRNRIYGEFETV